MDFSAKTARGAPSPSGGVPCTQALCPVLRSVWPSREAGGAARHSPGDTAAGLGSVAPAAAAGPPRGAGGCGAGIRAHLCVARGLLLQSSPPRPPPPAEEPYLALCHQLPKISENQIYFPTAARAPLRAARSLNPRHPGRRCEGRLRGRPGSLHNHRQRAPRHRLPKRPAC